MGIKGVVINIIIVSILKYVFGKGPEATQNIEVIPKSKTRRTVRR